VSGVRRRRHSLQNTERQKSAFCSPAKRQISVALRDVQVSDERENQEEPLAQRTCKALPAGVMGKDKSTELRLF
jgi:hypothetical protein